MHIVEFPVTACKMEALAGVNKTTLADIIELFGVCKNVNINRNIKPIFAALYLLAYARTLPSEPVGNMFEFRFAFVRFKESVFCELIFFAAMLAGKSEIDVGAQVPPFKRKVLNEIDHESILEGIEECKQKIAEYDLLADEVERELSMLKTRATDPGELYAKMQANDARIEELRQQHKAYYVALRAIECASENLRDEISPRLGEYSTELMSIMTDQKYDSFDVSGGLKLSFKNEEGEERSVDFLSGGTRDLAYIAVRMALIEMLYTEKPPICFDESFAHQDNVRARSMMKAIKALADEGHQSFVFTCRQRESVIAGELCESTEIFKLAGAQDNAN